jgi:hypothetical protein
MAPDTGMPGEGAPAGGASGVGAKAVMVQIRWVANPFRGDKFADAWGAPAEAVLKYGATWWAFLRASEGRLDFTQLALFPDKTDFDRYWYSEEIAEARAAASGLYQVPVLPQWLRVVDGGALAPAPAGA